MQIMMPRLMHAQSGSAANTHNDHKDKAKKKKEKKKSKESEQMARCSKVRAQAERLYFCVRARARVFSLTLRAAIHTDWVERS
jgi:hypothetical protein